MSELALPKHPQLTGAKRLLKPFHGLFWAASESQLNHVQMSGQTGELSQHPWTVNIDAGNDGGQIIVTKLSIDEKTERTLTVNFSRDEQYGHLAYLNAVQVTTPAGHREELAHDRLLAGPSEFAVVEFNPFSVVSALHAAANVAKQA